MGKTRGQLKAQVQNNVFELGFNFFSDTDFNDAVQDGYDDIVMLTQCIQKKVTLPWISNLSYYNFRDRFGISDYLGTIAIFNNLTNLWLRDDLSLKDFDRIRRDWENWIGTPIFWAPSDPYSVAICPKPLDTTLRYGAYDGGSFDGGSFAIDTSASSNLNNFILFYWAIAPQLQSDNDGFLVASDQDTTIAQYATADLLEQVQEYNKASSYWEHYFMNVDEYSDRVKRNCKSDLLLRV